MTCYSDGKIYGYEMTGDLKNDYSASKIFTAAGALYPRSVVFVEPLNKIIVAYESGIVAFFDIGLPSCPVCLLIRFEEDSQ